MNEILIRNGNQPEMRFKGQSIEDSTFQVDLDDDESREFKLQVYAVEGGGFVTKLQYETTSENEKSVVLYEDMDLLKDVENFFLVFEANEIMPDLQRINRTDRLHLMSVYRQIAQVYEASMFKFLDLVRIRAWQQKFGDRVIEKVNKPSILRTLGLRR